MGYLHDTIKGVTWLGALRILTRLLTFFKTAIIARILTPFQFGIFSIASLTLSLIEILTETGINIFLIQQKEDIDKYVATAWVVSIIRGVLIAVFIVLLAYPIAVFFQNSQSYDLLLFISIVPIIRGFINPSVARFLKDLDFHKEFFYRTGIFFVETLVTVVFIFYTQSPISIVWGLIVGAVFEVVLSFSLARPLPYFSFHKNHFQTIIYHGKWLTLAGIFNYLYHNADNIVVGRVLGTASLGLYDMAYKISMLPISEVSDVVTRVTFPVYVKISDDVQRLQRALVRSLVVVVGLVVPFVIVFFFFPEFIIYILLGPQWSQAVSIVQALAIFGAIRAITYTCFSFFYAIKRQDIVTLITFVSFCGMITTVVPFIYTFGLVGAAYSAVFGAFLALPLLIYYVITISRVLSKHPSV